MMWNTTEVSGAHRTQLYLELIHAGVVLCVVFAVTFLACVVPNVIPNDVIGTVFGGALGYAAGRSGGAVARDTGRVTDVTGNSE